VTNKHVVKGGYEYRVIFSRADENGNLLNINERLTMRGSDSDWISHPDENVDLCVLPIGPALNGFIQAGKHLLTIPLSLELLPTKTLIKDMGCMEEVTMIGYPNGIWDEANNLPIVRRGITATPYRYDYRGEKEFLVDMACYPGSSGSPVFLYNEGTYLENGAVVVGSRLYLLGILRAVPIRNVLGIYDCSRKRSRHVELGHRHQVRTPERLRPNLERALECSRIIFRSPAARGVGAPERCGPR